MMENKCQVTLQSGQTATFALFKGLDSCKDIRKTVMSGSLECSLLKTRMILDVFQVQVATQRALQLYSAENMTTKNVHSEILYCLSPSRNITESFKNFGVSDGDTSVFAVFVNDENDERFLKVCEILGHKPVPLTDANDLGDADAITEAYKLTSEELSVYSVLDAVVSRIAAKEVITASGKGKR